MKRSLMLGSLAAAALTVSLGIDRADAAPIQVAPLAAATVTADTPTAVNYRGRHHYYRPGFALYLGGPSYGPRCWWSHRHHRRVCSYY